jgi:hypothetical protein
MKWCAAQEMFTRSSANLESDVGMTQILPFWKAPDLMNLVIRGRLKVQNRILISQHIHIILLFYFSLLFFGPYTNLLFPLVFKQNLCDLRDTFLFNKIIDTFWCIPETLI